MEVLFLNVLKLLRIFIGVIRGEEIVVFMRLWYWWGFFRRIRGFRFLFGYFLTVELRL